MAALPSPTSESRADRAMRDGSLLAHLRHCRPSHAQLREAILILCDHAARLADERVSEALDDASDAADKGDLAQAAFRLDDAQSAMGSRARP